MRRLAAVQWPHGRPLFGAHAELPWPAAPHLALWHAQTLLREYRGDGHVALLTTAGLTPVEALALNEAGRALRQDLEDRTDELAVGPGRPCSSSCRWRPWPSSAHAGSCA